MGHEHAIQLKTNTWSAVNSDLSELLTWAHGMVTTYWSADTKSWQVSIDHNMEVQYQR